MCVKLYMHNIYSYVQNHRNIKTKGLIRKLPFITTVYYLFKYCKILDIRC